MAKTFRQPADSVSVPAPVGGTVAGNVYVIDHLVGVAATTEAAGDLVTLHVTGSFLVTKLGTDDVAIGNALYWDTGNNRATLTATSNKVMGYALAPAGNGVTTVEVRLQPNMVAP